MKKFKKAMALSLALAMGLSLVACGGSTEETTEAETTPKDYSTVLQGGHLYYLHLGYRKDASTDIGDDKFTVNSVKVEFALFNL